MSGAPAFLVASLLAAGTGCVPMLGTKSGRVVDVDPRPIAKGVTTKADLLAAAGPPLAVASPGELVTVSYPRPKAIFFPYDEWAFLDDASYVQQADAWFEPFAARRPITPAHRVYYWAGTTQRGVYAWLALVGFDVRAFYEHEVWALVDEERGIVEDVFHRVR